MNAENGIEYSANKIRRVSKAQVWTGRIISILLALLLIMGGVMDVMKPDFVVKTTTQMGYPEGIIQPLGVVVLICVILYLIPNTAVLGAILLTGYLGGAVATHVRAGDPLFSHVLVPVYFATLLWGGLYLRYERVRALVSFWK
jgi:DoxX-like family